MDSDKKKKSELSFSELLDIIQAYELKRLGSDFLEKLALLIISILGFLVALSWEEALKITMQEFFRGLGAWGERFMFPIIMTVLAVILSIIISRYFVHKEQKLLKSRNRRS